MNVKKVDLIKNINIKIILILNNLFLVAIYKSLSGTINTCADECPANCYLDYILFINRLTKQK